MALTAAITDGKGAPSGVDVDKLLRWAKSETRGERLYANLRLLRALGIFAGGVFVARNFGEALFVA